MPPHYRKSLHEAPEEVQCLIIDDIIRKNAGGIYEDRTP